MPYYKILLLQIIFGVIWNVLKDFVGGLKMQLSFSASVPLPASVPTFFETALCRPSRPLWLYVCYVWEFARISSWYMEMDIPLQNFPNFCGFYMFLCHPLLPFPLPVNDLEDASFVFRFSSKTFACSTFLLFRV